MQRTYQRLPNGSYMSQPRHPITKERVTITAETADELEAKLRRFREVRSDINFGLTQNEAEARLKPAIGIRMLIDECFELYVKGLNRSREKAAWAWEKRLQPYFGGMAVIELTADKMKAWEAEHQRLGFAKATIGLAYDMLAAAVNLQIPAVVPGLPWGKWRPARETKDELYVPKRPAIWNLASAKAIVREAAADDESSWRAGRYSCYATIAMVLILTGMRQAEAAGLGWDHVSIDDASNDVMFIEWQAAKGWSGRHADRPRDEPKDGARRQRMHPAVVALLRQQRAELQRRGWFDANGPVFPAPGGRWLETGIVVKPRRIKRWAERAGLPNPERWCAHSFRHSFVMLEIDANEGDLVSVMERSGHSDLRVIRGYMHARGRLMAAPKVGLLPHEATALRPALESSVVETPLLPRATGDMGEMLAIADEARTRTQAERAKERTKKHDATYDSLEEIYQRWVKAGKPGSQPREITAKARRAYLKGYNRGVRQRASPEKCRAIGKQERGRFMGAWALAMQRLSKRGDPGEAAE